MHLVEDIRWRRRRKKKIKLSDNDEGTDDDQRCMRNHCEKENISHFKSDGDFIIHINNRYLFIYSFIALHCERAQQEVEKKEKNFNSNKRHECTFFPTGKMLEAEKNRD